MSIKVGIRTCLIFEWLKTLWSSNGSCSELRCTQSQIWQHCGLKVGILGTRSPKYVRVKGITNWSHYSIYKVTFVFRTKYRRILQPGIAIRLKFADSSIIRVWTYKQLPRSIRYSPDLNTYILDEYDEYLGIRDNSNTKSKYSPKFDQQLNIEHFCLVFKLDPLTHVIKPFKLLSRIQLWWLRG